MSRRRMAEEAAIEFDANDFVVKNAPPTICYIPNFITEGEEEQLLDDVIERTPRPKWRILPSQRRCANYGGIVGKHALIVANDIPSWLARVMRRIDAIKNALPSDCATNHVLVNEYHPGQGIMPHTDGPAYFSCVCTLSIGENTMLNLYNGSSVDADRNENFSLEQRLAGRVYLERRSLFILKDKAYSDMMHGIDNTSNDVIDERVYNVSALKKRQVGDEIARKNTRYSLTIRHVPKRSNALCSLWK